MRPLSTIPTFPRLDFAAAVALGRAFLLAALVAPRLPEAAAITRNQLVMRLELLIEAAGGRLPSPAEARSPAARSGHKLDTAWSALCLWLEGMASLSGEHPALGVAKDALDALFPEGRPLVRPPPLLEWADSEARLVRLEKGGFSEPLRALGGGPILDVLLCAHVEHARTVETIPGGALCTRRVRKALDAFALALHAHVSVILAELSDGEPESTALAHVLLGPLDFARESLEGSEPTLDAMDALEAISPLPFSEPFWDTDPPREKAA